MALHFTDNNKSNASASAIKTPFLIEDILDRHSMKAGNKISFKNHNDNIASHSARNNSGSEHQMNAQSDKNSRNNNEIQSNDDEYRKLLQNERYVMFSRCGLHLDMNSPPACFRILKFFQELKEKHISKFFM